MEQLGNHSMDAPSWLEESWHDNNQNWLHGKWTEVGSEDVLGLMDDTVGTLGTHFGILGLEMFGCEIWDS